MPQQVNLLTGKLKKQDKAEYELHISGQAETFKTLIGECLEGSTCDSDKGLVELSTDKNIYKSIIIPYSS